MVRWIIVQMDDGARARRWTCAQFFPKPCDMYMKTDPKELDEWFIFSGTASWNEQHWIENGKSQLSIPGHLDLQGGTYRTDVPTTFRVAVQIAVSIASNSTFFDGRIDVSAALLSGAPIDISKYEL